MQPFDEYLSRLDSFEFIDGLDDNLQYVFSEEVLWPALREKYFKGVTWDDLIQRGLNIYRSHKDRDVGLYETYRDVETYYPFSTEEYMDYIDALDQALDKETNPPTRAERNILDENLIK